MKILPEMNLPPGYANESDGCTFPWFLKWLRWLLGAFRLKHYCWEHDFLREYGVVPAETADLLLRNRIYADPDFGNVHAEIYYWAVKLSRRHYSRVNRLPKAYVPYADYYVDVLVY